MGIMDALLKIADDFAVQDDFDVRCPECGEPMAYSSSQCLYKCPECGYEMDEDDYEPDADEDGVPFGCQACGGPYPQCKTSCTLFDD